MKLELNERIFIAGSTGMAGSAIIRMLKQHGYLGSSDEEIVDRWFQTLCRTIGNEQGIDSVASGYVQINRTPDGKTEVS